MDRKFVITEIREDINIFITKLKATINSSRPAQVVYRRLLNALAALLRSPVRLCGTCGGQSTGAGFLRVFQFPLSVRIPSAATYLLIIPTAPSNNKLKI
jgi:hypothetical protein